MLATAVLDAARAKMKVGFEARDLTLAKELHALASSSSRSETVGIELRLICERDMFDRVAMAWGGLSRAYDAESGKRYPGLTQDLMAALRTVMTDAGVNLATHLRLHATELAPAIKGAQPIDGKWLRTLRERSLDRQTQAVSSYISRLRRGLLR